MTVGELMTAIAAAGDMGKEFYVRLPDGRKEKIIGVYGEGISTPYRTFILLYGKDKDACIASEVLDVLMFMMKRFAALSVVEVGRIVEIPQGIAYTEETKVCGVEDCYGQLTLLCGEAEVPRVKARTGDAASILRAVAYERSTIKVRYWFGGVSGELENPTLSQLVSVHLSADRIEPRPMLAVYAEAGGEWWEIGSVLKAYFMKLGL